MHVNTFSNTIKQTNYFWDDIDVIHYEINLNITSLLLKEIHGYTTLTMVSKKDELDSISLYLQGLQIDSILSENENLSFSQIDSIIFISLLQPVNYGDTLKLTIYYGGFPVIDPDFGGFYFSNDGNYAFNIGVAFKDNPHNYGRVWFPCIDNFTDRAYYDVKITTKAPQVAICGGTLTERTENQADSTIISHWKLHDPIPTYLASVAVSNYTVVTDTFNGIMGDIPIDIYCRPPDSTGAVGSFINTKQILHAFEDYFGPYRWERVGFVGVPFDGAMEHATNIAYPRSAMNGTLNYEWLIAHELAHNWFGNLVTCASAEEMWINEGWAVFSEFMYLEALYGNETAREYIRNRKKYVLHKAHIDDNGYRAVHGVPHEYTYGTTVYDKGGIVINMLRHHLGDSLFFGTVKGFLNDSAFKTITTFELIDYFINNTFAEVGDFFDAWILRPGFSAVTVDSFFVEQNQSDYDVTIFFKQKLKGTMQYAQNLKFEVLFTDNNWNQHIDVAVIDGEMQSLTFTVPFAPSSIIIDADDKTAMATTKNIKKIFDNNSYVFGNTYCKLEINGLSNDSALAIVKHHWVKPDNDISAEDNICRISDYRYWEIDGIYPEDVNIKTSFQFNRTASGYLDNTFLPTVNSADSLVLLYRPDASQNWQIINFTKTGNNNAGYLESENVIPGEYALGIICVQNNILETTPKNTNIMNVFPNPSKGQFTIEIEKEFSNGKINIFNSLGKLIETIKLENGQRKVQWTPNGQSSGVYIIQLFDTRKKEILDSKSIIYQY